MSEREEPVLERAAEGLATGWLAAKSWPWLIRLGLWAMSLAALAAYGGIAWWRARRAVLAGALDDEVNEPGPPPSVVARDQGVLGWVKGETLPGGDRAGAGSLLRAGLLAPGAAGSKDKTLDATGLPK